MARKFTTGFEAGTEWTTTNGSPTIVTTQANSGTHSLRCHPTTSQQTSISQEIDPDGNRDHVFLRAYIYVATAPAGTTGIMAWSGENTSVSDFYGVKMTSSRTLIITASGSTSGGTATAAIPLNTWTRVEFDYDDPNGTGKIYIDGTLATTRTGIALEGGVYARFGVINPTTADIYFDDIAVNDSTGGSDNGLPGPVATDQEVTLGTARETNAAQSITRFVPNLSSIVDNFNDGTINADLWTDSYNVGRISETGGRARVTCGTDYNAFATAAAYTLTGSTLHVQVFPTEAGGATVEAWSQVLIMSATPGTDLVMEVDAVAGEVNMALRVDYFDENAVRITYDPEAHAWFRIREDAGTLYWETAPDGETWTQRRTATTPTWAADANIALQLISHRDAGADTVTEFDNVNTLPSGIEAFLGPAVETGSARGLPVGKAAPLGPAATAGAGRPLTAAKSTTLGPARAVEAARPLAVTRTVGLGAAGEVAAARPVTSTLVVPLGQARETAAAGSLTAARTAGLRAAREEAAGRPLIASKGTALAGAREASSAGAVGHARTAALGVAADTTTARALAASHAVSVAQAGSLDRARSMVAAKTARLGAARSSEQATALMSVGVIQLTAARTDETARPLAGGKTTTLAAAAGPDTARAYAGGKARPLAAAAAADGTRPLAGGKARTVEGARELARAGALTGGKQVVLGAARARDAAAALGVLLSGGLGIAQSREAGRPLGGAKAFTLGAARAADAARPLTGSRTRRLDPARGVDGARPLTVGKTATVTAARCVERVTRLTVNGLAILGTARTIDRAGAWRQPFQIRRLHAAHATDRAGVLTVLQQRPADQLTATTSGPHLVPAVTGPLLDPSTAGPVLVATTFGPSLRATQTQGG